MARSEGSDSSQKLFSLEQTLKTQSISSPLSGLYFMYNICCFPPINKNKINFKIRTGLSTILQWLASELLYILYTLCFDSMREKYGKESELGREGKGTGGVFMQSKVVNKLEEAWPPACLYLQILWFIRREKERQPRESDSSGFHRGNSTVNIK